MGNSHSTDSPKSPSSGAHHGPATSAPSSPFGDEGKSSPHNRYQGPSRKPQASSGRPISSLTQSLVSTGGSPSTSTSSAYARATVSGSPQRSGHTRARSATASVSLSQPLPSSYRSDSGAGGDNSSISSSSENRPAAPRPSVPKSTPNPTKMSPPVSQPVDVPQPSAIVPQPQSDPDADNIITGYSESPYGLPPATFSRPPRLPLPIEEEVYTPGSPIITPQDIFTPLDASEVEGALPRKTSVLSSTTADDYDDDRDDNGAFAAETSNSLQPRIPTLVEWNGGGEKIFVTGTFCNWEKKMKLHRNKDRPGFSAHVSLPPGTHHLKFLMDGEMVTSDDMPTTVDWTNILVNYIEIVAPLPPTPAEPIPIPGAAVDKEEAPAPGKLESGPPSHKPEGFAPDTTASLLSTIDQADGPKPDEEPLPTPTAPITPTSMPPTPQVQPESKPSAPRHKIPRPKYTDQIPDFLSDLDNYNNPEDERFQRASKVAHHLPQPPSLPSFLGKSILNSSTPHKDDASVLVLPNHTVINHLATSSIKSGVLATSGTTRYRQKFLTTIMFKPTSNDG